VRVVAAAPRAQRREQGARRFSLPERPVALWTTLWLAGAACELGALWPVLLGEQALPAADIVFRTTGGSFVATGLFAWQRRPANRVGPLMVATGFALFVQPLASQVDLSLVKTFGLLGTDYWMVLLVVLLLVFPRGEGPLGSVDRVILAGFLVPLVVLQPLWMLFLAEPGLANDFAVWPNEQAADVIDKCQRAVLLLATISLFGVVTSRWRRASPPLRRVLVPVLVAGSMMLSLGVLLTIDLVTGARSQTWLLVTAVVLAAVPAAFLAGFLRARLARVAVGDLFVDLSDSPAPRELREALRKSLRDPSLTLAYWLPEFGTYADLDGRPIQLPDADPRRATTLIDRDGSRVAALLHDPALREERELLHAVTAGAGIALENARLHVELRARLEELHGSRARIVEAGHKERQRLERNLHDGAQQRLVGLSLELSLLEGQLDGNSNLRVRLDAARREIAASLEELREIARGIHPAVVSAHGLAVALEQLAARATVPVRLTVEVDGRLPEPLEVAAFYLVSEGLTNVGKYANASCASVDVIRTNGHVLIEVVDDGIGGADTERGSGLRGLADRVEALDGRLRVWSPRGGGTRVRAEIPCAS
jgi:signal transduction histidine kinase